MCMHMQACVHAHTYTYTYTRIHVHIYVHKHTLSIHHFFYTGTCSADGPYGETLCDKGVPHSAGHLYTPGKMAYNRYRKRPRPKNIPYHATISHSLGGFSVSTDTQDPKGTTSHLRDLPRPPHPAKEPFLRETKFLGRRRRLNSLRSEVAPLESWVSGDADKLFGRVAEDCMVCFVVGRGGARRLQNRS